MSDFHLNILASSPRKVGKDKDKEMLELQGTINYADGRIEVFVFSMWPNRQTGKLPEVKAGRYLPVVELRHDWQSRKLMADIVDLKPFPLPTAKAAA